MSCRLWCGDVTQVMTQTGDPGDGVEWQRGGGGGGAGGVEGGGVEEGGSPSGGGVKHAAQHGLSHHHLPGQKSHPPLIPIFTPTLTTPPSHPHSSPSASAPEDVPGPWRPGPRVSLSPYGSCRCSHAGRDSAAWGQVQVQLQVEAGAG